MTTLAEQAARYARAHPQKAALAWLDRSKRTYDAEKAVRLCAAPETAAQIVGAEARDKTLEELLNRLLDEE